MSTTPKTNRENNTMQDTTIRIDDIAAPTTQRADVLVTEAELAILMQTGYEPKRSSLPNDRSMGDSATTFLANRNNPAIQAAARRARLQQIGN